MALENTLEVSQSESISRSNSPYINRSIERRVGRTLNYYNRHGYSEITRRLKELEMEWDIQRVLGAGFAGMVLLSSLLAVTKDKKWALVSGITSVCMLQHAFRGTCLPETLTKKLNVRSSSEINEERLSLQNLLKEYQNL